MTIDPTYMLTEWIGEPVRVKGVTHIIFECNHPMDRIDHQDFTTVYMDASGEPDDYESIKQTCTQCGAVYNDMFEEWEGRYE